VTLSCRLPSYSAVGERPGATADDKQTVCELFYFGAEAMTWARDRVDERGGGAIVLFADAGSLFLLGQVRDSARAAATRAGRQRL
jgi:hypothetical protein